jgi:chemotaxis protein MotB
MAKKKQRCPGGGAPAWMLTWGDMTTLLLTFFILLFNISEITQNELQLILSQFRGSFGIQPGGKTLEKGILAEMGSTIESMPSSRAGSKLDRAVKRAMQVLRPEITSKKVRIREDERGIVISLAADTFFEPGSAELHVDAKDVLDKIGHLILDLKQNMNMDNKIAVEGHTDARPPVPGGDTFYKYPTNLDLSSARATTCVKFFWDMGLPRTRTWQGRSDYAKFSSVGYGGHQPIEPNDTPEAMAYNRRVDIVILREGPIGDR